MDYNSYEERDLESGETGSEEETSNDSILGDKPAKYMFGRLRSGFFGYDGYSSGDCSTSTYSKSGTSSEDPHENIELLVDRNSGGSVEGVPLLEKKHAKEKRKISFQKASKPPRPPKGPKLDIADVKLVMEISELAVKKRARIQRIKALRKMKAEISSSSSSSNSSLAAMAVTLLFCLILLFQGILSRHSSSTSLQGSPEPTPAEHGLISVQLYNKTPTSKHNVATSIFPNSAEHVTDLEIRPQDKANEA